MSDVNGADGESRAITTRLHLTELNLHHERRLALRHGTVAALLGPRERVVLCTIGALPLHLRQREPHESLAEVFVLACNACLPLEPPAKLEDCGGGSLCCLALLERGAVLPMARGFKGD